MFPNLKCIKCSEEGCIKLHLDDLTTFECNECSETFTVEEIEAHVKEWQRCLAWVGTASAVEA